MPPLGCVAAAVSYSTWMFSVNAQSGATLLDCPRGGSARLRAGATRRKGSRASGSSAAASPIADQGLSGPDASEITCSPGRAACKSPLWSHSAGGDQYREGDVERALCAGSRERTGE